MRLADIVRHLDALAPPAAAEPWDNVGLLVGDPAAGVRRGVLCIDYTAAVAVEAKAAGCDFVLAYHPPVFKPLKKWTADGASALVFDAVRRGVAIYSPHTALDVVAGGTNDVLADVVGLGERRPIVTAASSPGTGPGRVGRLDRPCERADLFERVKHGLGVDHVLIAGPTAGTATTVAVCAGSCGTLLESVLATNADVYVTGEVRHHDALRFAAAGMTVIATLHSHSERVTLRRLAARLSNELPGVTWTVAESDTDPFRVV